ncbi:MAG: sulfatase [Verrucomicrobiales bacterium]|nr:sulfatase [Verrucomicrobiales bacterium]
MRFLQLIGLILLLGGVARADLAGSRPNMVIIIADDMAWNDCSLYGNKGLPTPNIDQLATQGMRFDRAFLTISSCSPSRASIITGRYPHQTDAEQLHWPIPKDQVTFTERLMKAGYWTASVGKFHMGEAMKDRFHVVKEADMSGFIVSPEGKFQESAEGDAKSGAAQWVQTMRQRPKDRPFFLWLAALDPHRPYDQKILNNPTKPENVTLPPYVPDTPEVRGDYALYYDEIRRLDRFVGEVMTELKSQNIDRNTMVLFISDNGRPMPRDKTTLYDSGIRTPWIVRWPGKIKAGSVNEELVSSVDIARTFMELAGVEYGNSFVGKSFLKMMENPGTVIRDYVFGEKNWHDFSDRCRYVRDKRFKYIRNLYPQYANTPSADALRSPVFRVMQKLHNTHKLNTAQQNCFIKPRPMEELYDLENDPHELENLAGKTEYGDVLNRLRAGLRGWQKRTNDMEPEFEAPDEFDRESCLPLPVRHRPRASKAQMLKQFREKGRIY